ncbi:hypothetical protein [Bradyrhizobium sp.]|jgi:hypothetical protein|uniref:hypothetical protein n=1 Tax=Bradyrhizobium sp. TaxID=376 RepID=UPI002D5B763B|nr:hypothetical protein [Bradyrhizobium sp.]HZR76473.1 hypothetical protein [Bradyrhizobium sp.]
MTKVPTSADEGPDEKITPLIESAILELVSLCVKLVSTPIAVLFNTSDYRKQLAALRADEFNTRYSPTVARPLSFYVLWMAAHFLLANTYWRSFSFDQSSPGKLGEQIPSQVEAASQFLKDHNWSDLTGTAQALIIIAFAVTLIIAVKSLLVTLIGWIIGCPIRFRTVLFGSAYTIGTLIFFQYAIILAHYAVNALGNFTEAGKIGYFVLIYGALLVSIVLTVRINQLIRVVDGTPEIPTFIAWFAGTALWLYFIVLATGALLGITFTFTMFVKLVINVFIPGLFPDVSL